MYPQLFGALFQTQQHSPRHEKSRRLDHIREQPGPDGLWAHATARYESCSALVNRVEAKLPHPIEAGDVPHIQHERATGFNGCHRPAWASPERNFVTNGEVLILGENAGCTRAIQITEEPVEPVVAV